MFDGRGVLADISVTASLCVEESDQGSQFINKLQTVVLFRYY